MLNNNGYILIKVVVWTRLEKSFSIRNHVYKAIDTSGQTPPT